MVKERSAFEADNGSLKQELARALMQVAALKKERDEAKEDARDAAVTLSKNHTHMLARIHEEQERAALAECDAAELRGRLQKAEAIAFDVRMSATERVQRIRAALAPSGTGEKA